MRTRLRFLEGFVAFAICHDIQAQPKLNACLNKAGQAWINCPDEWGFTTYTLAYCAGLRSRLIDIILQSDVSLLREYWEATNLPQIDAFENFLSPLREQEELVSNSYEATISTPSHLNL